MRKRLLNAKVLTLVLGIAAVLMLVAVTNHGAAPDPVQAAAAVDYFLKIDGIDGESTDKDHKGEIDVLSWSWGMSQSDTNTGDGTVVPDFEELKLTKYVDKSTPKLMEALAGGVPLRQEAHMIVSNAAGTDYFMIHMTNVMVTSISTGGSGGEDRLTENVTLNFAEVKVEYKPQGSKSSDGVEHTFIWNTEG